MKLKEAIMAAREHKCKLQCKSLGMYEQSGKDLLHWLIGDIYGGQFQLESYLKATDWELDFTGFTYHLRAVLGCSPKTLSFKTYAAREKYLDKFIAEHGSEDDGADNFIDMRFEGKITFDSLRK